MGKGGNGGRGEGTECEGKEKGDWVGFFLRTIPRLLYFGHFGIVKHKQEG